VILPDNASTLSSPDKPKTYQGEEGRSQRGEDLFGQEQAIGLAVSSLADTKKRRKATKKRGNASTPMVTLPGMHSDRRFYPLVNHPF
jgi:hypothetical protein